MWACPQTPLERFTPLGLASKCLQLSGVPSCLSEFPSYFQTLSTSLLHPPGDAQGRNNYVKPQSDFRQMSIIGQGMDMDKRSCFWSGRSYHSARDRCSPRRDQDRRISIELKDLAARVAGL